MENHHLVGGWATPLKNMCESIGMMTATQYFWENSPNGNQTTHQSPSFSWVSQLFLWPVSSSHTVKKYQRVTMRRRHADAKEVRRWDCWTWRWTDGENHDVDPWVENMGLPQKKTTWDCLFSWVSHVHMFISSSFRWVQGRNGSSCARWDHIGWATPRDSPRMSNPD